MIDPIPIPVKRLAILILCTPSLFFQACSPKQAGQRPNDDIAETNNLADQHPGKLNSLDAKLRDLVSRGSSRPGAMDGNDTRVRIDITQEVRWGAPLTQ